ncbi:MAG: hypothetical protein IPM54_40115 [Polyangiaceae bacterium]|nr:hypothetical protein [Polyangiaceae bacterium]
MTPNLDDLYIVLSQWAAAGKPQTYKQLSRAYQARTGDWVEFYGGWDAPLGELNNRLASIGAPAISALVILQGQNEPGGGFWGSAPNVPPRPKRYDDRIAEWSRILRDVLTHRWPPMLPP